MKITIAICMGRFDVDFVIGKSARRMGYISFNVRWPPNQHQQQLQLHV